MHPNQINHPARRRRLWILFIALLGVVLLFLAVWVNQGRKSNYSLPATLDEHMTYEVLNIYPHDPEAFTQGLIYFDGFLYESTGLYGESTLRKVNLESGEVLERIDLAPEYFAEGLTFWNETLVQLTWREGTGFVYSLDDFSLLERFTYPTEGWGLTQDGERLILSDGTATLYFLDPVTFLAEDSVTVTYQGEPIQRINELEYIRGEVYANLWQTDEIIRIDPANGQVLGWIDLTGILPSEFRQDDTDVLNGIAYDLEGDRLFITGKFWPKLFEVRLISIPAGN